MFIASDGVFDTLSNKEIINIIWYTIEYYKKILPKPSKYYGEILNECVNNVLKTALIKKSDDNVTAILVCFTNLLF